MIVDNKYVFIIDDTELILSDTKLYLSDFTLCIIFIEINDQRGILYVKVY